MSEKIYQVLLPGGTFYIPADARPGDPRASWIYSRFVADLLARDVGGTVVELGLLPTPKQQSSKRSKRRAYSINPSSPEVVQAFMKSRQPATEEGIQEFIAKHYGGWMKQFKKSHPDEDPSEVWDDIQREFTEALERHFKFKD